MEELPKGIYSLYNLQTLKLSKCFNLKKLPDNLTDLGDLRHLYINGCDKLVSNALDAENAGLSSKHNLHSIMLYWNGVGSLEQFSRWMNDSQQLQNLVKIAIDGCGTCKELPPLGQLSFLNMLHLHNIDEVKHIVSKIIWYDEELQTTLFPSLEVLSMSNMKNLESLWEIEGSSAQVIPHGVKQWSGGVEDVRWWSDEAQGVRQWSGGAQGFRRWFGRVEDVRW
ncbi:hypothetical protein IEQ34_005021 [Dendrobium chrysotoxum]|uniref:R13L1/DRL21-like LRR repeat region domain-containing protein n=1 Tax=Dendrobium chrysotoxum TaxID=161865 RepID=A0AAV7HBI1_DENCH|nr:hypothetical protein IEQ34_005021 [Dendrobium chrysotoxum]